MAAMVLTEHLRRAGLAERVRVTSAGTGPWHVGEPADARAAETLRRNRYPVEHVAAQVDDEHLAADLLLAADAGHLRALRGKLAEPERAVLLRSFDPNAPEGAEIPDPYYGGENGFDEVLGMIESAVPQLVEWVRSRL